MSDKTIDTSLLILDVSRGLSILDIDDKKYYFKHPSNISSLKNEEYYKQRLTEAVKKGIKTEKQLIDLYIKNRKWSIKEEEKIKSLKWMIDKSIAASAKITDETQKKVFENSIADQRQELLELEDKRGNLVNQNAESWARQQSIIKTAADHLFEDELLTKNIDFKEDWRLIIAVQKKNAELSNKKNLLSAVYEPSFFDVFSLQSRDPLSVFGVNFFTITVFQRLLLSYASVVLSKLRNIEMPDNVKEDPVKVYEYNPDNKQKETKISHGVDDLKNTIRQKGKLTPEDLIK